MPAASAVTSVEAFLGCLEKSGVVPLVELGAIREAAAKVSDPKQVARDLIKAGTMTKWQAGQLLHNFHALIVGKFELLDQLGSGELGRVYLVEQTETKQRHALKVFAKKHTSEEKRIKRFLAESQQARKLEHRNFVRLDEIYTEGDRCHVLMEFVQGQDLQRRVEGGGRMPAAQALEVIRQTAEGLAFAHERGVVHGRLKPANLLMDGTGTVRILDLGQSQLGAAGEEKVEAANDVRALGSVLCYLVTGKRAATREEVDSLLHETADVPEEIITLCGRLLSDQPVERIDSLHELLTHLDLAIWQASTPASPAAVPQAAENLFEEAVLPLDAEPKPAEKQPATVKAAIVPAAGASIAASKESCVEGDGAAKEAIVKSDAPTALLESAPDPDGSALATADISAPGASGRKRLLLGALGAGGVLVLGAVLALVLFLRSGTTSKVVQTASATTPAVAVESATADAMPETPTEQIAESGAANSVAPQAAASATEGPAEAGAAGATSSAPSTPPDAGQSAPAKSAESKPVEEKPPAAKTEAKPEAKPAAKPAPPKAPPKPPVFQGFAKAVTLPDLPQTASEPSSQILDWITLGPCNIDEKIQLTAQLKGGNTIFRGGKQSFLLVPVEGTPTRDWDFQFKNGETLTVIARLSVRDKKLDFQWTEEGVKQASTSHLLCNCAAELAAGNQKHAFNLRQAANGPPLAISIDKGGGTGRWVFDHVPDIKQVFIEATRFDGMRFHRVEPPEPITPGADLTVWTGPKDDALFLGLKFDSGTMAKGVRMTVAVQVKQEGIERPQNYNKKEVANRIDKLTQERTMLNEQLQEASKPPPPGIDRAKLDAFKAKLKEEVDMRTKRIGKVETLSKYVTDVQGAVAVHFRVFYQADDRQVDLFIAGDPPPPPRPVRRPPPKAAEADKK